jgi:hypothetical protein
MEHRHVRYFLMQEELVLNARSSDGVSLLKDKANFASEAFAQFRFAEKSDAGICNPTIFNCIGGIARSGSHTDMKPDRFYLVGRTSYKSKD